MNKKHNVVMLPIKKATKNCILQDMVVGGLKINYDTDNYQYSPENFTPQHLYFVSDELPTKPGWCINRNLDTVYRIKELIGDISNWMPIVATTNPNLWYKIVETTDCWGAEQVKDVPKIPLSFVEAYVKAEGKIDKVMLEYNVTRVNHTEGGYDYSILKLRPDGSVIVHPYKEKMYTREEMFDACKKYESYLMWCRKLGQTQRNEKWFDTEFPI